MKYFRLGFYGLKEIFYYAYVLIISNVFLLFLIFVLTNLAIFGAKAKGVNYVGSIPVVLYSRYIFITELVMINRRDRNFINDIKSGSIIRYLNKPIHFVLFCLSDGFFKNVLRMLIVGLFCGVIVFLFTLDFPRYGTFQFVLFVLSMIVGIGLLSLVSIIIGLFAFVFEDSSFIRLIIHKLYFIFGGIFFPIDIYPIWLQNIIKYFPFQYYVYSPAKFFATGDIGFFISYFPIQVVWFGIMLFSTIQFYNLLVKKIQINGG